MADDTFEEETFEQRDIACHLMLLGRCADRAEDEARRVGEEVERFREVLRAYVVDQIEPAPDVKRVLIAFGEVRAALGRLVEEIKDAEQHLDEVPVQILRGGT